MATQSRANNHPQSVKHDADAELGISIIFVMNFSNAVWKKRYRPKRASSRWLPESM